MNRFWPAGKKWFSYDPKRLIDHRLRNEFCASRSNWQLICDIDKTYLETNFESWRDLVQTAFQKAEHKQTVVGASEVLLAARWGSSRATEMDGFPNGLHFISSSPPQMRSTLQRKLLLDGLDWCSDTFKDQAYNLWRGRLSLLKNHVTYKSLAIIQNLRNLPTKAKVALIGDNAEYDAFIFHGMDSYLKGKLNLNQYMQYLQFAVPGDQDTQELAQLFEVKPSAKIAAILIREAPGYQNTKVDGFATQIFYFSNFWQAALALWFQGFIEDPALEELLICFHNRYHFPLLEMCVAWENTFLHLPEETQQQHQQLFKQLETLKAQPQIKENPLAARPQPQVNFGGFHEDFAIESEILKGAQFWIQRMNELKRGVTR